MSGHPLSLARWLRLGLACLVLALGGTPARAMPELPAVAMLVQRAPTSSHVLADVSVPRGQGVESPGAWGLARDFHALQVPETRLPAPPRRLFLMHRALLH